ncbi:MAG: hypothetical protein OEZ22_01830 [Spirochaetia bacterium]|nr:hypothetical protein [Spirochaetia bacterium]
MLKLELSESELKERIKKIIQKRYSNCSAIFYSAVNFEKNKNKADSNQPIIIGLKSSENIPNIVIKDIETKINKLATLKKINIINIMAADEALRKSLESNGAVIFEQ